MALYDHIRVPVPPTIGPPPAIPNMPPPPVPSAAQPSLFDAFGGVKHEDLYPYSPWDSSLWLELFIIADEVNHEFTVRLEWLRAVGANLMLDPQFGFRIMPIIDPTGTNGWNSQQHFEKERECLDPYYNQVVEALKELRRRYDAGKIR
jgi:hypothetical protein